MFSPYALLTTFKYSVHTTLNSHVDFYGGRKTGEPGENPSWHRREQHIKQTQLTYNPAQAGARTQALEVR